MRYFICWILLVIACRAPALLAEDQVPTPRQWFTTFAQKWDEQAWTQKNRFRPAGYMRPDDDAGWRARMLTIRGLVAHGQAAVAPLVKTLEQSDEPQRILAAQTLGFLAPHVSQEVLLKAAREDSSAAVRLYAVDCLAMQGHASATVDWKALLKQEVNRDVKKHIGYALERQNAPLEPRVVRSLLQWDPQTIDSAQVGRLAPDFALSSIDGEVIRLSHYRGKQPVVLVFCLRRHLTSLSWTARAVARQIAVAAQARRSAHSGRSP